MKENINRLPDKTLLNAREVATFLGVPLRMIYQWQKKGLIRGVKIKSLVRIYRDSVVNLVTTAPS